MKWKQVYEPLKRTLKRVKNASKYDNQKATRLMNIKRTTKRSIRRGIRRCKWRLAKRGSGESQDIEMKGILTGSKCHIKKCTDESWWTDEKRRERCRNGVVEWTREGLLTLRKWVKTVMCSFVYRFSLVNGKGSQVDDTNVSKGWWTSVWKSAWYRMNRRESR